MSKFSVVVLAVSYFLIGCSTLSGTHRTPAADAEPKSDNTQIREMYINGISNNTKLFPCKVTDGSDSPQAVVALYHQQNPGRYVLGLAPTFLIVAGPYYGGMAVCGGSKKVTCKTANDQNSGNNFSDENVSKFTVERDGVSFVAKGVKYSCSGIVSN